MRRSSLGVAIGVAVALTALAGVAGVAATAGPAPYASEAPPMAHLHQAEGAGMGAGCNGSLSLQASASPANGTAPLTVAFSSTVAGGCPPYLVHWEFGDGNDATGGNVSYTYQGAGLYHVWAEASDSVESSAGQSLLVVVTGGSGEATVQVGVAPSTGAAPLAVTCWANVSGGNFSDDLQVSWEFGDGGTGTGSPVTHVFVDPGTFTVTATAQGESGESASGSYPITVQANGTPTVPLLALNASPSRGTAPLPVNVTATVRGAASNLTLSICFGDNSPCRAAPAGWSPAGQTTLSHTYASPGNYSVAGTLEAANGSTVAGATVAVHVEAGSPVSVQGTAVLLGDGTPSTVRFLAVAMGGTPPYSIQWTFGDGAYGSSLLGSPVDHTYGRAGTYQALVVVTDAAGHRAQAALAPVTVIGPSLLGVPTGYWVGGGLGAVVGVAVLLPALRRRRRRQRRLASEGERLVREMEQAK